MASLNLHDFTGAEAMGRPRIQSHFSFIPFHFLHSLHKPSLLSPHVCHVYPNVILPLISFVPFRVFDKSRSSRESEWLYLLLKLISNHSLRWWFPLLPGIFQLLRPKKTFLSPCFLNAQSLLNSPISSSILIHMVTSDHKPMITEQRKIPSL